MNISIIAYNVEKIPDSIKSFHHDYHEVELYLEIIYLIRIFALKYLNGLDPQLVLVQQVHLKEIRRLLIRYRICRAVFKNGLFANSGYCFIFAGCEEEKQNDKPQDVKKPLADAHERKQADSNRLTINVV